MTDETLPPFGPKMLALPTDKQRAFVIALYDEEAPIHGEGLLTYAATRAYAKPDGTSSNGSLRATAGRLIQDQRIQAAIAEYSHSVVRAVAPEAIAALKKVIRDPKHRDHMRAISAVADRVLPIEQSATLKIEDRRPTQEITAAVLARIEDLFRRAGLSAKVIDGQCSVVGDGA